jgi:hypothetical protein
VTAVASEVQHPERDLTAELRRARERIAALEAELELHRRAERDLLRRVERATGRSAA